MLSNPLLRPLHGDPRYAALMERLTFPKIETAGAETHG
jgi:hypothetical protein